MGEPELLHHGINAQKLENQMQQVADLFCGAGGTSTGVLQAAQELGQRVHLVAVNHWDLAISTHSENHPKVDHFNSDLQNLDPLLAVPSGKLRLLVASPECTHFSRARGGKPMSKQSRSSIKWILKWMNVLDVEDVLIENVPDFLTWGPLDQRTKLPIKERKGEYFHRFIRKLRRIGYTVDWRVLNAADYGDPTTRKRLFIIARKHSLIHWPEPTHHKYGGDMFGSLPHWRSAREIIDWTIKSESIFKRKKPLAENTLRRIQAGLLKYCGKAFVIGQQSGAVARDVDQPIPTVAGAGAISLIEPFLVTTNWGDTNRSTARSVNEPVPTIMGHKTIGLAEPFLVEYHNGKNSERRTKSVDDPLPTLDTSNRFGLVEPFILSQFSQGIPHSVDDPLSTITSTSRGIALVEPFFVEYYGNGHTASIDEPMKTLTGRDRFGLVEPQTFEHEGKRYVLDIRFRMLQPHELARAMSFPDDYRFHGNREQIVKQIGNAVPVSLARELVKSLLKTTAEYAN